MVRSGRRSERGIRSGIAALFAGAAMLPMAAAAAPAGYMIGGGYWMSPDSARATDSGMGVSVGYAWWTTSRLWTEARVFGNVLETDVPGMTDYYQSGLGVDFVRTFSSSDSGFIALLGGGVIRNDVTPDSRDASGGFFNAGIGYRTAAHRNWGTRLRTELRYVADQFEDGQGDLLLGFVLEIPPKRVRLVEKPVEKIVEVEKVVEVERVVEVEKVVYRDVSVPAAPPADSDGDGVPDAQDRCPDTVAGARVGDDGCVHEEQVVVLPSIEFEFASAILTDGGKQQLEIVYRFLDEQRNVSVDVLGHTDWKGKQDYNQKLSEDRAASVRFYLVGRGIPPHRLRSEGFGELQPLATNETEEGRARNRRVELRIHTDMPGAAGGA